MSSATIDYDRVAKAAGKLKASPPTHDEIIKDPKAFLAEQGIVIDAKIEKMILAAGKKTAKSPRSGGIIHIDIPT